MAVDARDSSAGNFWRPGAFAPSSTRPRPSSPRSIRSARAAHSAACRSIIVAYSGGYLPAAYSLAYGGARDRVRGVVLFDALYGEPDKFARWIEAGARPRVLRQRLFRLVEGGERGVAGAAGARRRPQRQSGLPDSLRPGVVAFVDAGDVGHEDFVNYAWTGDPLRDVLSRVGQ